MVLEALQVRDFRNFRQADLQLGPGVNLLLGPNGSGKTNLLEAVALALSGRSPRGARDGELCRWGAERYLVRACVLTRGCRHALVVSGPTPGGRCVRLDGKEVSRLQLCGLVPHVWFGPDDLELVKGAPPVRRRFLDWLAAQVEPVHAADLLAYERILSQRNHLLRQIQERRASKAMADLFDEALLRAGLAVAGRRRAVLRRLEPLVRQRHRSLAGGEGELELRYQGESGDLEEERRRLEALREEELARGQTLWGPQRHDLLVLLNGRPARQFASQGEQRTAVLALKLAEYDLLRAVWEEEPVLLLDDVFSELDPDRARALAAFACSAGQVLVTAADPAAATWFPEARAFAVEQGELRERDRCGAAG